MLFPSLFDFFFPRTCACCRARLSTGEASVCAPCLYFLPRLSNHSGEHGPVEQLFWGRIPIERAACMFYFGSEQTRRIVHSFKYFGRPEVARDVAAAFAEELLARTDFFEGIDAIVPLPLHSRKRKARGYNQCDFLAAGIRQATGLPVLEGTVERVVNNPSQTRLAARQRVENVAGIFRLVRPELIENRHILLVDDTITTGSTLASCGAELAKAKGARISVLALAFAGQLNDYPSDIL